MIHYIFIFINLSQINWFYFYKNKNSLLLDFKINNQKATTELNFKEDFV